MSDAVFHALSMFAPRMSERREAAFDESEHPRETNGEFAPAGGGGEHSKEAPTSTAPKDAPKGGLFARARAALAGKAGAVRTALKGAWQSISTPAGRTALKAKVAAALRQEATETKAMATTFGKMLRGEKVSPEEKKAAFTQAVDLAHKVVTAALMVGGLPPPLNHAIHAAEHAVGAGKLLSAVIHKVAHHGLDHAIEKAASKMVGKHIGLLPTAFHAVRRNVLRSDGEIDPATQAVMEALMDEIASAMEGMSEDEIADLMAEAAEPRDAEQEARGEQARVPAGQHGGGQFAAAGGAGGGGEKPLAPTTTPRIRKPRLSRIADQVSDMVDDATPLKPGDEPGWVLVDGSRDPMKPDIVDGMHRVAGWVAWARKNDMDIGEVKVPVVDVGGAPEHLIAAAASPDGSDEYTQKEAIAELIKLADAD